MQDKMEGEFLFQCCGHQPQSKSSPGLRLSASHLWSRPWGVAWLFGLCRVPLHPIPWKGSCCTTKTVEALFAAGKNLINWEQ